MTNQIILGPAKGANSDDACGHWMIRIRAFFNGWKIPPDSRVKFAPLKFVANLPKWFRLCDPKDRSVRCTLPSVRCFHAPKIFPKTNLCKKHLNDGSRHFSSKTGVVQRLGFSDRIGL